MAQLFEVEFVSVLITNIDYQEMNVLLPHNILNLLDFCLRNLLATFRKETNESKVALCIKFCVGVLKRVTAL